MEPMEISSITRGKVSKTQITTQNHERGQEVGGLGEEIAEMVGRERDERGKR